MVSFRSDSAFFEKSLAEMNVFAEFRQAVITAVESLNLSGDLPLKAVTVEPPRDPAHGDLATNVAMVIAKPAGMPPRALAMGDRPASCSRSVVRSRADAQAAANAGARFAVSPGYTSAVGQACRDVGLALLPGVATGGEIMMAQEDGFTQLKFFPAMQAGGPAMLKAWSGPFFDVMFCPTGGVTLQNAPDFLALPNVVCVGGSWLVPADALAQGDWARITQLAKDTQHLKK